MINNIRYADDTVFMADNMADLQSMTDHFVQHIEQFELNININKTKVPVFSNSDNVIVVIKKK